MAHFYGTLQGNRGQATRCGSKESGVRTEAASWSGCVSVWVDRNGEQDEARVSLTRWHGTGTDAILYDGPINPGADNVARYLMPGANAEGLRIVAAELLRRAEAMEPALAAV